MADAKAERERRKGKITKIAQHRHCQICSKAIPLDIELCSEACEEQFSALLRKRKGMLYFMYGMIAVLFVFLLIQLTAGMG
jgi:predicted nucleic acid-binding Zn ribbon protein